MRKHIWLLKHAALITGLLIGAVLVFIFLKWAFHLYDIQKLNNTGVKVDQAIKDEELYLLWNCPSHVDSPHKVEWDKAVRFKNLMHRQDAKS